MCRGNGFVQPKKVDSIGRLLGHIRVTMCNQLSVDAPRVGGGRGVLLRQRHEMLGNSTRSFPAVVETMKWAA